LNTEILPTLNTASQFPASFAGDPSTFNSALFGLMVTACLSFAVLSKFVHELKVYGWRMAEPVGLYRFHVACLMLAFFVSTAPDAVFLLTWGEVTEQTTRNLLTVDRLGDSLTPIPFIVALCVMTRGEPAVMFQLTKQPLPVDLWPTWPMVRRNLLIVGLVLFISVGVTLTK
jgi:hypothetical protein